MNRVHASSARGDRVERIGAGAPPVVTLGIIGQAASRIQAKGVMSTENKREARWRSELLKEL